MTTRNSPLRINELSRITRTLFRQHHHGVGLFVLIATLFVLSFLAGLQPPMQFRVFMAGEVADSDVVAHRSLTVEDTEAAKIKRNQVAMLQPTVFDLSVTEIAALRQKIFGMLKLINGQETSPEAQDALRASLAEKLATPVSSDLLAQWMSPEVQEYVLSTGLPWFEDRLREGVVGDVRLALPSKNGIIVRDVDTKAETLRPDVKRTVAYAASSVMPGSSGAAAPNGPEQQGAAPAAPHTPVPPSANPGPPIDLVYPVVPGPPKPVNKGPLSMKPVGKRP